MVQIEELPDDFEERMHLTDTAPSASPSQRDAPSTIGEIMAPELPPALAQHHGKSPSELWESLNRTPLFMTSIDESDGAGGENIELEALKALAYEGPPLEVTANFKEQGNECFREKRWKDAVEFYTKGLAVVLDDRRKEKDAETGPDGSDHVLANGNGDFTPQRELAEDEKEMAKMEESLLLNRAACNLELQNYRRAITDCAAAIRLNVSHPSPKAYYRTTVALLRLSKLEEADDALVRGLHLAPRDPALLRLGREVDQRRKTAEEERRRRTEREERALREKTALQVAIRQRGWVLVSSSGANGARSLHQETVDLQDARITLADAVDPKSVLHLPLLFLYPMAAQSDFIKSVPETATLAEELGLVLPVPWEEEGPASSSSSSVSSSSAKEYQNVASVECFVQTVMLPLAPSAPGNDRDKRRGLVKVGKKIEIGSIVGPSPQPRKTTGHSQGGSPSQAKQVYLEDGMLKVFVVPKGKTAEFVEESKRRLLP